MHCIFITLNEDKEWRNRFPGRDGFKRETASPRDPVSPSLYYDITLYANVQTEITPSKSKSNDCRVRVYAKRAKLTIIVFLFCSPRVRGRVPFAVPVTRLISFVDGAFSYCLPCLGCLCKQ